MEFNGEGSAGAYIMTYCETIISLFNRTLNNSKPQLGTIVAGQICLSIYLFKVSIALALQDIPVCVGNTVNKIKIRPIDALFKVLGLTDFLIY